MAGIGNKDIAEHGKATQFGAGNDARDIGGRSKIAAWSIRGWARYFAAQELDLNDPDALKKLLGRKPTVAQVLAVKMLAKAAEGNLKATELAMDSVEGKLTQHNINHNYDKLSDDELRAERARLQGQLDCDDSTTDRDATQGHESGATKGDNKT